MRPFEPFVLFQKSVRGGFASAWEVLSNMGTATYIFRGAEADLAEKLNAALLRAIRFAREPIHLSQAELRTTGQHRHYAPLLDRSNSLKFLKARFARRDGDVCRARGGALRRPGLNVPPGTPTPTHRRRAGTNCPRILEEVV